jgi:hypothetical protein
MFMGNSYDLERVSLGLVGTFLPVFARWRIIAISGTIPLPPATRKSGEWS